MPWLIFLLALLLPVLIVLKIRQLRREQRQRNSVMPPLNGLLPQGVAAPPRMLLYFYSEHCGNCRSVAPLIEEFHRRGGGVVKVDVRRHLVTARRFGIRETPSLVLVDRGRIACVHRGTFNDTILQRFYRECRTS